MKRLVLIILLSIGALQVMAQTAGSPLGNATSYIPLKGGFKIDSGLYLPKKFPLSYRSLDSTGLLWYDLITKHVWYHNGTARKETVPKTYVDSAVSSVSAGAVSIGSPIGASIPFKLLYVDGSSNLAQNGITVSNIGGDIMSFTSTIGPTATISGGDMEVADGAGSGSGNSVALLSNSGVNALSYTQAGGSLAILTTSLTSTKTQTFQNDTGLIALLKNLPTMSSFTTSGVAGVSTYTTTVTSGFTLSIVQSKNANATVDYSSVSGTTLTVHTDSVTAGSSNLTFSYFLK